MPKVTLLTGQKMNVTDAMAKALKKAGKLQPKPKPPKFVPEPVVLAPVEAVPVKRVYRRRVAVPAVTTVMTPEE